MSICAPVAPAAGSNKPRVEARVASAAHKTTTRPPFCVASSASAWSARRIGARAPHRLRNNRSQRRTGQEDRVSAVAKTLQLVDRQRRDGLREFSLLFHSFEQVRAHAMP